MRQLVVVLRDDLGDHPLVLTDVGEGFRIDDAQRTLENALFDEPGVTNVRSM